MRSNKGKLFLVLGILMVFGVSFAVPVSASLWDSIWGDGSNEERVQFLTQYEDYLSYGNFLTSIFNTIGWWFIQGLYFITAAVEGLIPETFTLLNFLESAGIESLTASIINDLVVALMVLVLVFIGFKTIIAKEPPNFKSVGVNIAVSAFLILGLPSLMAMMQNVAIDFYDGTQTGDNNEGVKSLSWGLIQDNTTDLLYISTVGFSTLDNDSAVKNSLTPDNISRSNLSALITPDTIKDVDSTEIENLGYRLDTDESGNTIATEIEGGAFGFFTDTFEEGYFRYDVNFFPVIIGLIALLVAYLFAIFVFITTIIEIGFKQVIGLFVFATDLESGQRTKMVVKDIMNAFLLIAFTGLSMQMFTMFLSFIASQSVNPFIYIFAIVSATFVLIKGSSTVMRYFGVDVGVKDGFAQLAGAFAVGRATAGGMKRFGGFGKGGKQNGGEDSSDSGDGVADTRDQLAQQGQARQKSIRDNQPSGKRMGALGGAASGLQESAQNMQSGADNVALAGMAGATAGASQQNEKENRKPFDQQLSKVQNQQSQNTSEMKGAGMTEGQKALAQYGVTQPDHLHDNQGVQQAKDRASLQNNLAGHGEGLQSQLKTNEQAQQLNDLQRHSGASESINGSKNNSQSNEEVLTNMKLNDAAQPTLKDATAQGQMDWKQKTEASPINQAQQEVAATKMENLTQGDNSLKRNSDTQPKLNDQGDLKQSITAERKFNDLQQQPNHVEGVGNINMRTNAEQPKMTEQGAMNQRVNSDLNMNKPSLDQAGKVNADMKVNTPNMNQNSQINANVNPDSPKNISIASATAAGQTVQRVMQQVENTSFANPAQAQQKILQEVQQASFTSGDQKQRVIQEIQQANVASPAQAKQNIEQVLFSANLRPEVQQSVQKVFQEVQQSGSAAPADVKAKVIQELEGAHFGTKEPIKQLIVEQVERGFNATPEQLEQNIKQTISRVENDLPASAKASGATEQKVVRKEENSGYFGKFLGKEYFETPEETKAAPSRFDKFKKYS